MNKLSITDLDLPGKRVFMRVDFNVPLAGGVITEDARIEAALPSIRYVNGAFGTAHRAHASTGGIVAFVKQAAAGFLMQKEIESLNHALTKAEKPYVAIVGGAKISDKIELIENFINIANTILIGGAMAYTFFRAQGLETGRSLVEMDKIDLCKQLLAHASPNNASTEPPVDNF